MANELTINMKLVVLCVVVWAAHGAPEGYGQQGGGTTGGVTCRDGEVLHVDGKCVMPIISRDIFVFSAPQIQRSFRPPPQIPPPKVDYSIVFVKTPEALGSLDPIIVPPPQKKTLVYVLSKKQEDEGQKVIQVPDTNTYDPEVFYVNYGPGENPTLPGGVDLSTALNSAVEPGQVIGNPSTSSGNGGGYSYQGNGASGGGVSFPGNGVSGGSAAPSPQLPSQTYGIR